VPAASGEAGVIPILDGLDLVVPPTLDAALDWLAARPAARPFAGGTDLMVLLEAGRLPVAEYVSLWHFDELRGISESADGTTEIGALTTFTAIRASAAIAARYPMLGEAAAQTGGVATQNRGTIGGNIANASPAADTPPALLVYDAELELLSAHGSRIVPYADFHTGYKTTRLEPGEIIARIRLPRRDGAWRDGYRKVGTRRAQAISKVCFAGAVRLREDGIVDDVRLALGSVAPAPVRCHAAERALRGSRLTRELLAEGTRALAADISPIDDLRSTAAYRARVAGNLLTAFLIDRRGDEVQAD
jgi:CO/xanthine dehydrogenase FAD-binding subunit